MAIWSGYINGINQDDSFGTIEAVIYTSNFLSYYRIGCVDLRHFNPAFRRAEIKVSLSV